MSSVEPGKPGQVTRLKNNKLCMWCHQWCHQWCKRARDPFKKQQILYSCEWSNKL